MTIAFIITICVMAIMLAVKQYIIERLREKHWKLLLHTESEETLSYRRNTHLIELAETREHFMKQEIKSLKLQIAEEKTRNGVLTK